MTRFVTALMDSETDPVAWARAREREGWHGIAVPDHVFIEKQPIAHIWVTATQMALATERVGIATSFANNLLRSPVEFAQAAIALQRASGGRLEAGLGAGWDQQELEATGVRFPPEARERAGRYIEAGTIVRELFDTGQCRFTGEWYDVDVGVIGPQVAAPPSLVVSVGGPRTTRALTPLADLVEVKLPGIATPGKGSFHTRSLAQVTRDDIARLLEGVLAHRADAAVSLFLAAGCGPDPVVAVLRERLAGSPFSSLFGEPNEVADTLHEIAALGFSRISIGPVTPDTAEWLAPSLLNHVAVTPD